MRRRRVDILTAAGALILILFAAAALFAPHLAPNDPDKITYTAKFCAPCREFPLGADHMGRCMLSRLLYGARPTLGYALLVTCVSAVIGTVFGMLSGFMGGAFDRLMMRGCDVMRAFPGIVFVFVAVSILGAGIGNVCIAMCVTRWIWYARVARNLTREERGKCCVTASLLAGSSRLRIIFTQIFPAIFTQLLAVFTIDFGGALLSISGYSFLGLGMQPPSSEWGTMINDGRAYINSHPSEMFWPGLCILLVVISVNLLGDALRDALEQRRT